MTTGCLMIGAVIEVNQLGNNSMREESGWCLTTGCLMIGSVIEVNQLGNNSMREESIVTFTTHGLTSYNKPTFCENKTSYRFPSTLASGYIDRTLRG